MRRVLLSSLAIGLLALGWAVKTSSLRPIDLVGRADTEVRKELGEPDIVVSPRPSHWCDSTPVAEEHASEKDRQCVRQWLYKEPPASCYSVCFGRDGRVAHTYHYVSP